MADWHVYECDECGDSVRTHNDNECGNVPEGWTVSVSEKGIACENCTQQLLLLKQVDLR